MIKKNLFVDIKLKNILFNQYKLKTIQSSNIND